MNRVHIKLCFLLAISVFLLSFCNNKTEKTGIIPNGKYQDESAMLSLDLKQSGDSIIGTHCFVAQKGKRIDCCLEEDGVSLRLAHLDKGVFVGTLKSCYDEKKRKVKLIIDSKKKISLSFNESIHPFLSSKMKFTVVSQR
jgi:hypothetical protein